MEWLVIGIVVIVGVVVLAYIVRSKQGPYSPDAQTKGDMAALNTTLPSTAEKTGPNDPAEADESQRAD